MKASRLTGSHRYSSKCPYRQNSYVELIDQRLKQRLGVSETETVLGVVFDGIEAAKGYWLLRVRFEGKRTLMGVFEGSVRRTDQCPRSQ